MGPQAGTDRVSDGLRFQQVSRVQCVCGWQSETVRGEVDLRMQECERLLQAHQASGECT